MANPNPDQSGLTPFEPGQSGNPGGKTAEQRKAEVAAAEQAALIQKAMLDALAAHIKLDPANALEAIKADPLRLIKDAMDRGFGTAVQTIDNTSSDGTMTPQPLASSVIMERLAKIAERSGTVGDDASGPAGRDDGGAD